MKKIIYGFCLVFFVGQASGALELSLFPAAELVEEEIQDDVASHLIVLGALEKINHELEPENSEVRNGKKSSWTYYLPQARRTREVRQFYLPQLDSLGRIAFECSGRTCGSSTYWANRIFERAILYGPEQFQHFVIVELADNSGYLSVYIGQRATRKIYVHIERVETSD